MPVEPVTYIDDFVITNPVGLSDPYSDADNHLRNMKIGIKNSFPGITGAMTATQVELNVLDGILTSTAELNHLQGIVGIPEELSQKNIASGYAPLDGSALLPLANIPAALTGKTAADALLLNGQSDYPRYSQAHTISGIWQHSVDARLGNTVALTGEVVATGTWIDLIQLSAGDAVNVGDATEETNIFAVGRIRARDCDIQLDNDYKLEFREFDGITVRQGLKMDTANNMELGSAFNVLQVMGSLTKLMNGGLTIDSGDITQTLGNGTVGAGIMAWTAGFGVIIGGFGSSIAHLNVTAPSGGEAFRTQVDNVAGDKTWIDFEDSGSGNLSRGRFLSRMGDQNIDITRDGSVTVAKILNGLDYLWLKEFPQVDSKYINEVLQCHYDGYGGLSTDRLYFSTARYDTINTDLATIANTAAGWVLTASETILVHIHLSLKANVPGHRDYIKLAIGLNTIAAAIPAEGATRVAYVEDWCEDQATDVAASCSASVKLTVGQTLTVYAGQDTGASSGQLASLTATAQRAA